MPVDLTPIFAALTANTGSVAAWEIVGVEDPTLSVFDVSGTPEQIVFASPTQEERKEVSARLAAAGHPTGYYATTADIVWRNGPAAFEVWAGEGTGLTATTDKLLLSDGTPLDRKAVTAVVPFTGRDDVARGVILRLGETDHIIAEHFKHLAAYRVDFEDGGGWKWIAWVSFMTRQLATWLDVPIIPK